MAEVKVILSATQPGILSYVAIGVRSNNKWLFIRHRERGGYEIPAGHPEEGEEGAVAAARELSEETGAKDFVMEHVTFYSVEGDSGTQHGELFYAEVTSFGDIKDTDEVESLLLAEKLPEDISLPVVMTALFERLQQHCMSR